MGSIPTRSIMRQKQIHWAGFKVQKSPVADDEMDGDCEFSTGRIRVDTKLRGRKELETLIHEGLHGLDPDMSEDRVLNTGRQLAALLWRWGYRLPGPKVKEKSDGR